MASRARWFERILGVVGLVAAIVIEQLSLAPFPWATRRRLPDWHAVQRRLERPSTARGVATPEKHEEIGRIEALHGKTWKHPAVVGDRLYVRNADEVVCYELFPEG